MSYQEYNENGVLKIWSDDETRLYHIYDDNGVEIGEPRAFTPEENTVADANAARDLAEAERNVLKAAVKLIITDARDERQLLDAEFTVTDATTGEPRQVSNTEIKDSPGKYIKANKRANMRTLAALIDLSKLIGLTP